VFFISITLLDVRTKIELQWTGTAANADPDLQVAAKAAIATLVDRIQ